MNPYQAITLANLANGGAEEVFQREQKKVLDNIADVNTDYKTPREITIKVKFLPNEKRDGAAMIVQATSRLAPPISASSALHLGRDAEGQRVALQNCAQQEDIFSTHSHPVSTT